MVLFALLMKDFLYVNQSLSPFPTPMFFNIGIFFRARCLDQSFLMFEILFELSIMIKVFSFWDSPLSLLLRFSSDLNSFPSTLLWPKSLSNYNLLLSPVSYDQPQPGLTPAFRTAFSLTSMEREFFYRVGTLQRYLSLVTAWTATKNCPTTRIEKLCANVPISKCSKLIEIF